MSVVYVPESPIKSQADESILTHEQLQAICLIVTGKGNCEIAETLGKDRRTIYRWRQNPYFIAELNRQQEEALANVKQRLQRLSTKAIDVFEHHLGENNLKAAVELMKLLNFYGRVVATDYQDDPELILKQQAEAIAAAELCKATYPDNPKGRLTRDIAEVISRKYQVKSYLEELLVNNSGDKGVEHEQREVK